MSESSADDLIPDPVPHFAPGDVVRHRRYGYRGVVVDFDLGCRADRDWYMRNRTQPDPAQPWYHVLVHGSALVTYPAEENLLPDESGSPVNHPLVPHFFEFRHDGGYERNTRPWPGWDAPSADDPDE